MTEEQEAITNQPVVIDNGSGLIKAGFAGDDLPKCSFPAYVGRPKHVKIMAGAVEGEYFIGHKAEDLRGLLKISYPISHGVVEEWDNMERIWTHIYANELKVQSEEHPVLLTEAPLNPKRNREKLAELFFETFNVPALFISIQAVLALYASGRTTGVVLDSGDGVTHSVPVYEGFAIPHSITRIDVAGRDVTEYLQLLLRKAGYNFHSSAEKEIVRSIKEQTCYVSYNPSKEEDLENQKTNPYAPYTLPDGNVIEVGPERFRAPEILFDPELIGQECIGIHQCLVNSIRRTDLDLRKTLFQSIVLSGGTTLLKGFGDRLLLEVKKLAPKDIRIRISAPPERKYSTWIGGSILASLATFKKIWISKEQYTEDALVVHRKTF